MLVGLMMMMALIFKGRKEIMIDLVVVAAAVVVW